VRGQRVARMVCKFYAAMPFRPAPTLLAALLLLAAGVPVQAEKADRSKPLTIEADQPSSLDLINQVVVFNGNVVMSQGTMAIRADRVEVRERPDGHRSAVALGSPNRPATFRQKREGLDETIEGQAQRIEYDSRGDVVRFAGDAQVRRLRGSQTADEISGSVITYDNGNETFSVQGAATAAGPAASAPGGRVRVVITPKPDAAASEPR
jgi:lipopolysaccharide export system protein LptA